jgi:hypothetical protein
VGTDNSFLDRDPDDRVVRWGWVLWFAWLAVGGALLLGDYRGGALGLGVILAAPFWAVWALWAVYRASRRAARWLKQSGMLERSGTYFEFDGHPIRIVFDVEDIWFAARDVFEALGTPQSARDPDRVRMIAGRDGLRPAPGNGVLSFTEKGLAAWLDRRTDRTASLFARWVALQVVRPYRRRRELDSTDEPSAGAGE